MADKQKQIPKEEAFSIFLAAFERLGIEYRQNFTSNTTSVKLPRGSYKRLADELIAIYSLDAKDPYFNNYGNYIKDRFNDVKVLLKQPIKEYFGYSVARFQPLINYAKRHLGTETSVTFPNQVLYNKGGYSLFNFWRKAQVGTLVKYSGQFIIKSTSEKIAVRGTFQMSRISFPPFQGEWLKIVDGQSTFYLSVSDGTGKLKPITLLLDFLSDITT